MLVGKGPDGREQGGYRLPPEEGEKVPEGVREGDAVALKKSLDEERKRKAREKSRDADTDMDYELPVAMSAAPPSPPSDSKMLLKLDDKSAQGPMYVSMPYEAGSDTPSAREMLMIAMNSKPGMIRQELRKFGFNRETEREWSETKARGDMFMYEILTSEDGESIESAGRVGDAMPEDMGILKISDEAAGSDRAALDFRYDRIKFSEANEIARDLYFAGMSSKYPLIKSENDVPKAAYAMILGDTAVMRMYADGSDIALKVVGQKIDSFERDFSGDTIADSSRFKNMFQNCGMDISEYVKDFGNDNMCKAVKDRVAKGETIDEVMRSGMEVSKHDSGNAKFNIDFAGIAAANGKGEMINVPTRHANSVIRTKRQPFNNFHIVSSANGEHKIANVEIPVFAGQVFDGDKRAGTATTLSFDIAKMTERDPSHTGMTTAGTPVTIHTDDSSLDMRDPRLYCLEIDLEAVARKSFDLKQQARERKGLPRTGAYDDVNRNRIGISQMHTTCEKGIGGVSVASVTKNVATMAAGMYILNAGEKTKADPDFGAYSKKSIDTLSKLYAREYKAFMTTAVARGCEGIPAHDRNGNPIPGKYIEGTSFRPLKMQGIKIADSERAGAFTLMKEYAYNGLDAKMESSRTGNPTLGQDLAAASKAFSIEFKRMINSEYRDDKEIRALGNAIGLNAYPVVPRDENNERLDITVVQPAMVLDVTPFASSLAKAVKVATHSYAVNGVEDATPDEVYGKKVIDKANEIIGYGNNDGSNNRYVTNDFRKALNNMNRETAKNEQIAQLKIICAETDVPYRTL